MLTDILSLLIRIFWNKFQKIIERENKLIFLINLDVSIVSTLNIT